MLNIFLNLPIMMRLHAPTGYLLSFFPAAFGLMLAYKKTYELMYIPLFLIASVIVRGAGCIINDIFDQDFDKKVSRTKQRPLARGDITTKEALVMVVMLSICCLSMLLILPMTAIIVGFIGFILTTIYPLMKRITYFPQVFLGLTFNIGCLIGYAALTNSISPDALLLYFACGFWTVAYDTIYAFMDIEDDKKIGVKSTAIFFEHMPYKPIIATLYTIFLLLFLFVFRDIVSIITLSAISICLAIAFWITFSLKINKPENCLVRFKLNNYIGFILFLSILLEKV